MTKLNILEVSQDIHLNIDKTFEFIQTYLPRNYTEETLNLLSEKDQVDRSYIRAVKTKRIQNKKIYTALYQVALTHKQELDQIKKN